MHPKYSMRYGPELGFAGTVSPCMHFNRPSKSASRGPAGKVGRKKIQKAAEEERGGSDFSADPGSNAELGFYFNHSEKLSDKTCY